MEKTRSLKRAEAFTKVVWIMPGWVLIFVCITEALNGLNTPSSFAVAFVMSNFLMIGGIWSTTKLLRKLWGWPG